MSDVQAKMPQEDVETKSTLTLILSKIAELWVGITSKFDRVSESIEYKGNWIVEKAAELKDHINIHTANKFNELEIMETMNTTVYITNNGNPLEAGQKLLVLNIPGKIMSGYINVDSNTRGGKLKITVDGYVYIIVFPAGSNREIIFPLDMAAAAGGIYIAFIKDYFVSMSISVPGLKVLKLLNGAETTLNESGFYIPLGKIKAYHKLEIEAVTSISNITCHFTIAHA